MQTTKDMFKCKACSTFKPKSDFPTAKNCKSGFRSKCRDCNNEYFRSYNKAGRIAADERTKKYFEVKLKNIKEQDERKFPEYVNTLTVEDMIEIFKFHNGKCVYSGKKLDSKGRGNIFNTVSFDRIDNNLPHEKGNLQLTSIFMNLQRGNTPHDEFKLRMEYI